MRLRGAAICTTAPLHLTLLTVCEVYRRPWDQVHRPSAQTAHDQSHLIFLKEDEHQRQCDLESVRFMFTLFQSAWTVYLISSFTTVGTLKGYWNFTFFFVSAFQWFKKSRKKWSPSSFIEHLVPTGFYKIFIFGQFQ